MNIHGTVIFLTRAVSPASGYEKKYSSMQSMKESAASAAPQACVGPAYQMCLDLLLLPSMIACVLSFISEVHTLNFPVASS